MGDPNQLAKRNAARAAAELVESGMRVGLGSGSTFLFALERLAERQREDDLDFVGVPTSEGTARRARELGIRLGSLDDFDSLDIAIDGADEIDPQKHMIKGGGAALVREKIVAAASHEMVVVVDSGKCVEVLGKFPLPVEVLGFGWRQVAIRLKGLGADASLRVVGDEPAFTDNGNHILDCRFPGIPEPVELEWRINLIPGVLDNGLFTNRAGRVFVGHADGSVQVT